MPGANSRRDFVYFIRPIGQEGPIKIGTSFWPESRLQSLMCWSPVDLEIVATVEGGFELERRIHSQFADHHIRNEWFRNNPRLDALIEAIKRGDSVTDFIDFDVPVKNIRKGYVRSPEHRRSIGYKTRLHFALDKLKSEKYYFIAPDDVEAIFDRWRAKGAGYHLGTPPTEEEIARLEQVIADPGTHAVRQELW